MIAGGRHTHAPDRQLDQLPFRARPEPTSPGSPDFALEAGRRNIAAGAKPGSSRPDCHQTFTKVWHDVLESIRRGHENSGLDTHGEAAADRVGSRSFPATGPAWICTGRGDRIAAGAAAVGFAHLAILSHRRSGRLHQLDPRPVRTAGIVASKIWQSRASDLLRTYKTSVATRRR